MILSTIQIHFFSIYNRHMAFLIESNKKENTMVTFYYGNVPSFSIAISGPQARLDIKP